MMVTPIVRSITSAIDASKEYTFLFDSYGGNQVVQHNIVIEDNSTGFEVYNRTNSSFQFKSTILANTLTQNLQYRVKIRTGDISNNWSEFSQWIVFWCYAPATITIPTVNTGVVNNQNVLFEGTYTQPNDGIQSYIFNLYTYENVLLSSSPVQYTTDPNSISYTFTGLKNNVQYKIELKTLSVHNVQVSTGLLAFTPTYLSPTLNSQVTLTNMGDQGYIQIDAQVIQILGTGTNFAYEDDEWVNITNSNGLISFSDGMTFSNDFTIKLWVKNITPELTFLRLLGENGSIQLQYYNNRFHCYKIASGLTYHYVNLSDIAITTDNVVCVMLRQINNAIDIEAEIIS